MGISTNDSEETDASSYLPNYQDTCVIYSDGKNTAMLPWKQDHQSLPTYYDITKKRTENTIKRLSQEPLLLKKYGEIIQEQENRGFIERVDENYPTTRLHYILHH